MEALNDDALHVLLGKLVQPPAGGDVPDQHADAYCHTWARRTLPLVCQRLNELLRGPSAVFEHLVVDPACEALFERRFRSARDGQPSPSGERSSPTSSRRPPGPAISPEAIARWLRSRSAGSVRSLSINSPGFNFTRRELEQIFGLLKRGLRRLAWTGSSLGEHELYECLAQLKQLEELRVAKASEAFLDALAGSLAFLPKLRALDFSLDLPPNSPSRLRDVPSHLTRLCMANVWLSELPRALAGLRRLASLELRSCRVDADPLPLCCGLPALQELHAVQLETQPAAARFGPSASLTSLRLSACGLQQVRPPPAAPPACDPAKPRLRRAHPPPHPAGVPQHHAAGRAARAGPEPQPRPGRQRAHVPARGAAPAGGARVPGPGGLRAGRGAAGRALPAAPAVARAPGGGRLGAGRPGAGGRCGVGGGGAGCRRLRAAAGEALQRSC
jgi:hypothetical protein